MKVVYNSHVDSFIRRVKRDLTKKKFVNQNGKLDMHYNPLAVDDGMCCMPIRDRPVVPEDPTLVLTVPHGTYEISGSRYPLLRLVVEVVKHRTWHWWRGEGWSD